MSSLRAELSRRTRRWQRTALPITQAALAAGIAWFLAFDVIGHPRPFFAPIAGVISIGLTHGQRLRRSIELVVGVSVGIGVGDLLISAIGSGLWQIALVVALAMSTAVLLDGGTVIAMQAASSAVLVATLLPPTSTGGFDRMVDALVGGLVGLAIAALLPANPLKNVHRAAGVVFGELAAALRGVATAIIELDMAKESAVLTRVRGTQAAIDEFRATLVAGTEITTLAPLRWPRRAELERYATAAVHIDRAVRNTRVLARRALAAVRDAEPVPPTLPDELERLAIAVDALRADLAEGQEPMRARAAATFAAAGASRDLLKGTGFSMRVVTAQVRSIAVDLLQATGSSRDDAVAALPPIQA